MDSMCEKSIRGPVMDQVDRSVQMVTMNNVESTSSRSLEKSASFKHRKGNDDDDHDDDHDHDESLPPTNGDNSNEIHP
jgi:hypothetical protein